MNSRPVSVPRRVRPDWLPPEGTLDSVAAGRWWDAIAIDGLLGVAAAKHLGYLAKGRTGPIVCDPLGPRRRTYFLAPAGTADRWSEPGTVPLGESCYVVMNGTLEADEGTVHWLRPPLCRYPEPLLSPGLLRTALAAARAESGAAQWLASGEDHPAVARAAWLRGGAATLRTGVHFDVLHLPAALVVGHIRGIKDRAAIERVFHAVGVDSAVIVSRSRDRYSVLVPPGSVRLGEGRHCNYLEFHPRTGWSRRVRTGSFRHRTGRTCSATHSMWRSSSGAFPDGVSHQHRKVGFSN